MTRLHCSFKHINNFIEAREIESFAPLVREAHMSLHDEAKAGHESLGWLNPKHEMKELKRIQACAQDVQANSDILIVIGVGGSYLGAKAAIHMLSHNFKALQWDDEGQGPHVIFAGHNLSSTYVGELLSIIKDRDISLNVISKSGTTTEPAIAFRFFRKLIENKYGKEEARKRIYVTTDRQEGALKTLADEEGYDSFVIPDNIGGRYSVLTPVGLFPMAVSGIDIEAVIEGMRHAEEDLNHSDLEENDAYKYAVTRNLLYRKGFSIEILANYDPKLTYFSDWWIQLFGESEGKERKGIFPSKANFPTDLHSLGQYIQDGERLLFETVLRVTEDKYPLHIEHDQDNLDELNYLEEMTLHEINLIASDASIVAHVEGGVPNIVIDIPALNDYYFGYLVYFFKKACAMSGYLLGVNPFDQPGVESYKRHMYEMLGKPGYVNV